MEDPQLQAVEFDVNLPKPSPRRVLGRVLLSIGVLALVGVIVAVVVNRTATPTSDPIAQIMPAQVAFYFSMTTRPDQQPNYQVIADAWKDSKEAKQIESALELAVMQVGVNWDDDIRPWLGPRIGVGLFDLGGSETTADSPLPRYRPPAIIAVAQTTNRTKSDAFLAAVRTELESRSKNTAFKDDVYHGVNFSYLTEGTTEVAYATVNDVVIIALGTDRLKQAIDASIDHTNLQASVSYQKAMGALPSENVAMLYMDYARYFEMYIQQQEQTLKTQPDMSATFDNIYTNVYSYSNSMPDPNMQKEIEARQQQREAARRQQEDQLQKLRAQLQGLKGGTGIVITYEPDGVRITNAAYSDPATATEAQRQLLARESTPAGEGHILSSVPDSALLVIQATMSSEAWQAMFEPEFLTTQMALNPSLNSLTALTGKSLPTALAEFEQQVGVSLKADLLGQLDGEMAFIIIPKDEQLQAKSDNPFAFSVPFELAVMVDTKDATRFIDTLDKILQAVADQSKSVVAWQSLSGLSHAALLDAADNVVLTYGSVDGRIVIGSTDNTLQAIDAADQSPLSASAKFKDASSHLSNGKVPEAYMDIAPLLNWYIGLFTSLGSYGGQPTDCGPCNYVKPFKYVVAEGNSQNGEVSTSTSFIKIEPTK